MMACATVVRAGQPPSGQPQTPTFRVAVDYVEVDVVVTDANSNSIRDLNKDDFQIFEDGKPQTIANFVPVDIPVERATQPFFATHTIEPDVRTNIQPFAGRMYVMVLDAAHTLPQNTPRTRAAARSFINENLGANDLMAVVGVDAGAGGGGGSGQEFTTNPRLLLAAVDSFRGDAPGSATLNRMGGTVRTAPDLRAARAAAGQPPPPLGDDGGFESDRNARALVEALTAVADWFSVVHSLKKSILLFSEGSSDMQDFFQNGGGRNTATRIQASMQDLVRTATKANVAIYAIDPRGLQGLAAGHRATRRHGRGSRRARASAGESSGAPEPGELRKSHRRLRGGEYQPNGKRVRSHCQRKQFLLHPCLLSAEPETRRQVSQYRCACDAAWSKRTVPQGICEPVGKSAGGESGRYAGAGRRDPEPDADQRAGDEGVRRAVQRSGAEFVRAARHRAARPRSGRLGPNGRVDIAYTVIDQHGKSQAGSRETLTLNLPPQTNERVAETGMRLLKRLSLKAGRYQLRVAAHDDASGAVGSVLYDLDVPDFNKPRLVMSGLVVTSAAGLALRTVQADPDLRGVLPGPPMAAREFGRNDQIALFTDVYDNDVTRIHKVDITTSLTSDSGRLVFMNEEERSTEDLGGKPAGFGIGKTLLLSDFEPGVYVLKVEARSRLGADITASRDLQIRIAEPK